MQMVRSITNQGEDRALFQMVWEVSGGPVAGGILIRLRSAKRRGSEGSCVAGCNVGSDSTGASAAGPKAEPNAKAQADVSCLGEGSGVSSCLPP